MSTAAPARCPAGWVALCSRIMPWHIANLVAVALLLCCQGSVPLLDPDEGRYGEIPREMLERGDWLNPTLNYVPYWEKPPLLYWINMVGLRLFGETPWGVRFGNAFTAVLGLLVAWWLARVTFGSRAARWAPAILAGTFMYFVVAHIPLIDMLFSMLLAASLTAWWSGENSAGGGRTVRRVLSGVFLGLAVLAKGPVALILMLGITGLYLLWGRRWRDLLPGTLIPLVVGSVVAAPWFILMSLRYPDFAHFFFVVQHWQRFLGSGARAEHVKPFYYFLVMSPLLFLPWSVLWPGMIAWLAARWRGLTPEFRRVAMYSLSWTGFTYLFFSASTCKLAQYILPVAWPLAVAVAAWLESRVDNGLMPKVVRRALVTLGLLELALVVGTIIAAGRQREVPLEVIHQPLAVFCLVATLSASLYMLLTLPGRPDRRLGLLMLAALVPPMALMPIYREVAKDRDMNGLLPPALYQLAPGNPWTLAQYDIYNQSYGFFTRQRILLIDEVSELPLGPRQADGAQWFLEGEDQVAKLSARGPLALVMREENAEAFARRHGLHLWRQNLDRAILFNDAGLKLANCSVAPSGACAPNAPIDRLDPRTKGGASEQP